MLETLLGMALMGGIAYLKGRDEDGNFSMSNLVDSIEKDVNKNDEKFCNRLKSMPDNQLWHGYENADSPKIKRMIQEELRRRRLL